MLLGAAAAAPPGGGLDWGEGRRQHHRRWQRLGYTGVHVPGVCFPRTSELPGAAVLTAVPLSASPPCPGHSWPRLLCLQQGRSTVFQPGPGPCSGAVPHCWGVVCGLLSVAVAQLAYLPGLPAWAAPPAHLGVQDSPGEPMPTVMLDDLEQPDVEKPDGRGSAAAAVIARSGRSVASSWCACLWPGGTEVGGTDPLRTIRAGWAGLVCDVSLIHLAPAWLRVKALSGLHASPAAGIVHCRRRCCLACLALLSSPRSSSRHRAPTPTAVRAQAASHRRPWAAVLRV